MFTREELYELYITQDKTQKEIGQEYGMSREMVSHYVRKFGLPRKSRKQVASKNKKLDITGDELLEMVNGGMLIREVAEKYNVSRNVISRIAKENGLNFTNHKAATERQSKFMKENNPFNNSSSRQKAIDNSIKTKREQVKAFRNQYSNFDDNMSFKEYAKKARYFAYFYYGRGKLIEDGKVIDHIYSVKDGYSNKVPLSIISNPSNLRLISQKQNLTKAFRSDITLQQLYDGVVFND